MCSEYGTKRALTEHRRKASFAHCCFSIALRPGISTPILKRLLHFILIAFSNFYEKIAKAFIFYFTWQTFVIWLQVVIT